MQEIMSKLKKIGQNLWFGWSYLLNYEYNKRLMVQNFSAFWSILLHHILQHINCTDLMFHFLIWHREPKSGQNGGGVSINYKKLNKVIFIEYYIWGCLKKYKVTTTKPLLVVDVRNHIQTKSKETATKSLVWFIVLFLYDTMN